MNKVPQAVDVLFRLGDGSKIDFWRLRICHGDWCEMLVLVKGGLDEPSQVSCVFMYAAALGVVERSWNIEKEPQRH